MGAAEASAGAREQDPRPRWSDVVIEFGLTAVLVFCAVTGVRWLVVADSPLVVADAAGAAAANGLFIGIVLVALIKSPLGRRSGAHMNPAISVALWLMGVFPGRWVAAYAGAQLAGSVAGTALGRLVWGPVLSRASVRYAAVRPGAAWGAWGVAAAECVCLVVVVVLVGFFLARPSRSRLLPYAVGAVTALIIAVLSEHSGASVNPSRQLGPAVFAGEMGLLWVYLLAPVIGAVAGAGVHRLLRCCLRVPGPCTYRLCGDEGAGVPGR